MLSKILERSTEAPNNLIKEMCSWLASEADLENAIVIKSEESISNLTTLTYLADDMELPDDWKYVGYREVACDFLPSFTSYFHKKPQNRSGGMAYTFEKEDQKFEAWSISAWVSEGSFSNDVWLIFASFDKKYEAVWLAFLDECNRVHNSVIPYRSETFVIGDFEMGENLINWDDISLPSNLRDEITHDIDSFFKKGVEIYKSLKIKPIRKLLLAGLPGTGKTMISTAIINWARENDYFTIYVSGTPTQGAEFWKIHRALDLAARSQSHTVVIVEEIDAYIEEKSMAHMLNVLDGSEAPNSEYGILLIATSNHPEKIDKRILKRPGRLDRIFIVPEVQDKLVATDMLKRYLSDSWDDAFEEIIPTLIGKSGAFIREISLFALTSAAYKGDEKLTLSMLQDSISLLNRQIDAKDDFLTQHKGTLMGLIKNNSTQD
ncbi:hypothetical protein MASR2M15_12000 [Anaerolineales bacterium]